MKTNYSTEIIINGTGDIIPTEIIPILLPYNIGDKFYYSERVVPNYFEKIRSKYLNVKPEIIDNIISVKKEKIKNNYTHEFKVVDKTSLTELSFNRDGETELNIVHTLTVENI